ncbi:MAG: peptidyl-prolyl cis-trans isomerase [Alphaproteobacteria bacterium]|nr:peptidyl-prolyl cis-trans isomerase [Alphaproteobacteria bacterium]
MKIKLGCATVVLSLFLAESLYGGALLKDFKKDKETETAVDQSSEAAVSGTETTSESEGNSTGSAKTAETAANTASSTVNQTAPAAPTVKKEIKGDPVVAKIGRAKEFRRSDVLKVIKTLPPQLTQGVSEDRLFAMCLDQLISAYLMVEQAKKAGMDKTKDFTDRVENMKNDLLARMFLMKEVAPKAENESALKARYTKYLVEFKKMKETQVFHIMLSSEDDAKAVIARLDKGEDFGKVAKDKSLAPSKEKDGEEGYIAIDILPSPIKEKLAALKKGEYTKEALKTDNGYHVFKLGDSRDTSPQKFEEIKDGLKQMIVQEEIMKLIDRLVKQFNVVRFNEDGSPITESSKAVAAPSAPAVAPSAVPGTVAAPAV